MIIYLEHLVMCLIFIIPSYFYKQIDGEKTFKEIYNIVNKYIDERIDNNARY